MANKRHRVKGPPYPSGHSEYAFRLGDKLRLRKNVGACLNSL